MVALSFTALVITIAAGMEGFTIPAQLHTDSQFVTIHIPATGDSVSDIEAAVVGSLEEDTEAAGGVQGGGAADIVMLT
jgi:hypothetical protein